MSRIVSILLALFAATAVWAAGRVTATLDTDTVFVGEPFELRLSSSDGMPRLRQWPTPDGLQLVGATGNWTSQRSINGRTSAEYTAGYQVVATRAGELVLPPLGVQLNGETVATSKLRLKALPASEKKMADPGGASVPLAEAVFGRIVLPPGRREFYLGEEVPLKVELWVLDGVQARLTGYPELKIPHAVFRDYRAVNEEDGRFGVPEPVRSRVENGRRYQCLVIPTAFRSLAPGSVRPEGTLAVGIVEPEERSRRSGFDDDFFGGFFSNFGRAPMKQYRIECTADGELQFKTLPPPPENTVPLGLIGDWKIDFSLDAPEKIRVGEVLSLHLRLRGDGSTENLKPPTLTLPGFRVYPPEIRSLREGGAVITYSMIPLRPGRAEIRLTPAVFVPAEGNYRSVPFARTLEVLPSDRPQAAGRVEAAPVDARAAAPADSPEAAPAPSSALLYLKTRPTAGPASDGRWLLPVLILAGPLWLGGAEWLRRRRLRRTGDAGFLRREAALGRRRAVLRQLAAARDSAELDRLVNTEVTPLLNDYLNLPPGLTATELADRIDDPELAELLRRTGEGAFRPGAAEAAPERSRESLGRALKRFLALLLLGTTLLSPVSAAESGAFQQGVAAYDAGDFATADRCFGDVLTADGGNGALFYNLGCTAYMRQDYPQAARYFETARLLLPRDSAVLENLNLTRRKLGLPETGRIASPRDLVLFCRGLLLPEGWLLLAAGAWSLLLVLISLRGICGRHAVRIGGAVLAAVALLALGAFYSLRQGPYRTDRAIALGNGAELRSLPAASGRPQGRIPGGHEVRVVERRSEYSLVRSGSLEGWADNREIAGIHP